MSVTPDTTGPIRAKDVRLDDAALHFRYSRNLRLSSRAPAPSAERAHVVMQDQKLLEQNDAFPLSTELTEEIAQSAAAGDIESEGFGKVLLRVLGGIRADVVRGCDRNAPALEVDPGIVHAAVGLVHLTEGPPELTGAGPVPVMVQEAVAQLVSDEAHEHGPGNFVPPALADDVALLDLHHVGVLRIHTRYPGPKKNPIVPILDSADQQEATDAGERPRDQVSTSGIPAAPGAGVHQIIHPTAAVRAFALEQPFLVPLLRTATPGTIGHGILNPAAASPVAARILPKSSRRLERFVARVTFFVNVGATPRAEGERIRDRPAALVAFGSRQRSEIAPAVRSAALRAESHVPLHPVPAYAALVAGPGARPPASTGAHSVGSRRQRCAG